jgi:energy-coupling factor transporter ATP-binding protein EcfA2
MLENSNITFKIDKSKTEGVADINTNIFPNHFLGLICGKPGSGKTSLLKFMLKDPNLLFKKYDYVFIVSPSFREYGDLFLPKQNFNSGLDFEWINNKIKSINSKESKSYTNVLFILDDVLSDLHKMPRSKEIMDFIFNRRHLLINGMISILVTTQKYNYIPTAIRSNITILFAFKLNNIDWKRVSEEIIFSDVNLSDVTNYVFKEPNSFLIYRIDTSEFFKNFDKMLNI